MDAQSRVPSLAVRLLREQGCTDGNCAFRGKATRMHTNGGCKCLNEIRNPTTRARLRAVLDEVHAAALSAPPVEPTGTMALAHSARAVEGA